MPFPYSGSEEWQYFISKKIQPIHQQYVSGYLAKLPTEMDEFWAECYEMSKVLTHKRSREIGESKLKFQSKYQEPYFALRKIENTRYNNVLGQLLSHSSFIKRRFVYFCHAFVYIWFIWCLFTFLSHICLHFWSAVCLLFAGG